MDQQPAPCKISEIKLRLSEHFVQSSRPSPFVSVRRDGVFMCLCLVSDLIHDINSHCISLAPHTFFSASYCILANCINASRVVQSSSSLLYVPQCFMSRVEDALKNAM